MFRCDKPCHFFLSVILPCLVHLKGIDSADNYEQFLTAAMSSLNIFIILMTSSMFLAASGGMFK